MKISFLSLGVHGTNENYGAVLQILAFQEYLRRVFNADVEVIDYYGLSTKSMIANKNNIAKRIVKKLWAIVNKKQDKLLIRMKKNEKFISQNLISSRRYNFNNIDKAKFDDDVYIAESDVIWDPTFRGTGFDKTYFLDCECFDNGKKIIYAASMGDIKFSEEHKQEFGQLIQKIKYISVRENYAKEYIESNYNRKVESLIDPTLLFDSEFYDNYIGKINNNIDNPYIIVYFPAEINYELLKVAEKYAEINQYDVLYLCRKQIPGRNTKIEIGINEFLFYVKNCQAVFCDSFHGVCFSIIYKKEFFAFARDDGKKIIDICMRFKLDNRIVSDGCISSDLVDYESVYKILYQERKRSLNWITNAIDECTTTN